MWQYQLPALVDRGLRCMAYDRRGCGRSDQPGDGYDFDTLAEDLANVIDLDLRDVTLVSHSMGSGEVARYLTRHGADRVARVALISPTLPSCCATRPTRTASTPPPSSRSSRRSVPTGPDT